VVDNSLWTETPAERQQRLADEVMGKKRRVENADPEELEGDKDAQQEDVHKRRKREAELQRQVEEYTVRPDRFTLYRTGFKLNTFDVETTRIFSDRTGVNRCSTHARRRRRSARKTRRAKSQVRSGTTRGTWGWAGG
jgi:hypothetical protein